MKTHIPRRPVTLVGLALAALLALGGQAPKADATPRAEDLRGEWVVDLRPKPGDPGYLRPFVVSAVDGRTFKGSFYDPRSEVQDARINTDWGAVRFAFTTADPNGEYHHSGVLKDSKIEGMTNAIGRKFLSYWSATRKK